MRVLWLSAFVILVDQATKVAVVNLMHKYQSIPLLGDWLKFTFTENPGMAFGMTFGPPGTVSVLALLATTLVAGYIWQVRHADLFYRTSIALILGGAIGNVIDRVAYGVIFGNGGPFTGRVVDFIHVDLWQGRILENVPGLGGGFFVDLFPIWNVADMAIVAGVIGVLAFHRRFHEQELRRQMEAQKAEDDASTDSSRDESDALDADGEGSGIESDAVEADAVETDPVDDPSTGRSAL